MQLTPQAARRASWTIATLTFLALWVLVLFPVWHYYQVTNMASGQQLPEFLSDSQMSALLAQKEPSRPYHTTNSALWEPSFGDSWVRRLAIVETLGQCLLVFLIAGLLLGGVRLVMRSNAALPNLEHPLVSLWSHRERLLLLLASVALVCLFWWPPFRDGSIHVTSTRRSLMEHFHPPISGIIDTPQLATEVFGLGLLVALLLGANRTGG